MQKTGKFWRPNGQDLQEEGPATSH